MALFNLFKRDQYPNRESVGTEDELTALSVTNDPVRQGLSVLKEDGSHQKVVGLDTIYKFLQSDFESKGYSDALINPDASYKSDNFILIQYDLQILLHQVATYHDDLLRELDFHIQSRSRAGLIDLVEELKNRKEMVSEHVKKVSAIKEELEQERGMTQRILLSYQRGFMKGLSAITQSNVLNKQF